MIVRRIITLLIALLFLTGCNDLAKRITGTSNGCIAPGNFGNQIREIFALQSNPREATGANKTGFTTVAHSVCPGSAAANNLKNNIWYDTGIDVVSTSHYLNIIVKGTVNFCSRTFSSTGSQSGGDLNIIDTTAGPCTRSQQMLKSTVNGLQPVDTSGLRCTPDGLETNPATNSDNYISSYSINNSDKLKIKINKPLSAKEMADKLVKDKATLVSVINTAGGDATTTDSVNAINDALKEIENTNNWHSPDGTDCPPTGTTTNSCKYNGDHIKVKIGNSGPWSLTDTSKFIKNPRPSHRAAGMPSDCNTDDNVGDTDTNDDDICTSYKYIGNDVLNGNVKFSISEVFTSKTVQTCPNGGTYGYAHNGWDFQDGMNCAFESGGYGCWQYTHTYIGPNCNTWKGYPVSVTTTSYDNNKGAYNILVETDATCIGNYKNVLAKIGTQEFAPSFDGNGVYSALPPAMGRLYLRIRDGAIASESPNYECDSQFADDNAIQTLYDNNVGALRVTVSAVERSETVTSLKSKIVDPFNAIFSQNFKQSYFSDLVGTGSSFNRLLTIIMVLYISVTAMMFLMGVTNITQTDLLQRIIRIGLVYTFVSPSSWEYFYQLIQFFELGSEEISELISTGIFTQASGSTSQTVSTSAYNLMDQIIYMLMQKEIHLKIAAVLFSPVLVGWFYVSMIYFAVFFIIFAIGKSLIIYMIIKLVFTTLFLVAPIFIAFSIFDSTRGIFKNWLQMVISYSFQMLFLFITISFFGYLILNVIYNTFFYGVCWGPIWNAKIGEYAEFELFNFWRVHGYSAKYSAAYNVSKGPDFVNVLFLLSLAYFFKEFIEKVTNLADSISGGGALGATASGLGASMMKDIGNGLKNAAKDLKNAAKGGGKFAMRTVGRVGVMASRSGISLGMAPAKYAVKAVGYAAGHTAGKLAVGVARHGLGGLYDTGKALGKEIKNGNVKASMNAALNNRKNLIKSDVKGVGKKIDGHISNFAKKASNVGEKIKGGASRSLNAIKNPKSSAKAVGSAAARGASKFGAKGADIFRNPVDNMKAARESLKGLGDDIARSSLAKEYRAMNKHNIKSSLGLKSKKLEQFERAGKKAYNEAMKQGVKDAKARGLVGQEKQEFLDKIMDIKLNKAGLNQRQKDAIKASNKYKNNSAKKLRYSAKEALKAMSDKDSKQSLKILGEVKGNLSSKKAFELVNSKQGKDRADTLKAVTARIYASDKDGKNPKSTYNKVRNLALKLSDQELRDNITAKYEKSRASHEYDVYEGDNGKIYRSLSGHNALIGVQKSGSYVVQQAELKAPFIRSSIFKSKRFRQQHGAKDRVNEFMERNKMFAQNIDSKAAAATGDNRSAPVNNLINQDLTSGTIAKYSAAAKRKGLTGSDKNSYVRSMVAARLSEQGVGKESRDALLASNQEFLHKKSRYSVQEAMDRVNSLTGEERDEEIRRIGYDMIKDVRVTSSHMTREQDLQQRIRETENDLKEHLKEVSGYSESKKELFFDEISDKSAALRTVRDEMKEELAGLSEKEKKQSLFERELTMNKQGRKEEGFLERGKKEIAERVTKEHIRNMQKAAQEKAEQKLEHNRKEEERAQREFERLEAQEVKADDYLQAKADLEKATAAREESEKFIEEEKYKTIYDENKKELKAKIKEEQQRVTEEYEQIQQLREFALALHNQEVEQKVIEQHNAEMDARENAEELRMQHALKKAEEEEALLLEKAIADEAERKRIGDDDNKSYEEYEAAEKARNKARAARDEARIKREKAEKALEDETYKLTNAERRKGLEGKIKAEQVKVSDDAVGKFMVEKDLIGTGIRNEAADKISKAFKDHKEHEAKKEADRLRQEQEERDEAATMIQNMARSRQAKKELDRLRQEKQEQEEAAIAIQKIARSRQAKKEADRLRQEKKENDAATAIQEAFRRRQVRDEARKNRAKMTKYKEEEEIQKNIESEITRLSEEQRQILDNRHEGRIKMDYVNREKSLRRNHEEDRKVAIQRQNDFIAESNRNLSNAEDRQARTNMSLKLHQSEDALSDIKNGMTGIEYAAHLMQDKVTGSKLGDMERKLAALKEKEAALDREAKDYRQKQAEIDVEAVRLQEDIAESGYKVSLSTRQEDSRAMEDAYKDLKEHQTKREQAIEEMNAERLEAGKRHQEALDRLAETRDNKLQKLQEDRESAARLLAAEEEKSLMHQEELARLKEESDQAEALFRETREEKEARLLAEQKEREDRAATKIQALVRGKQVRDQKEEEDLFAEFDDDLGDLLPDENEGGVERDKEQQESVMAEIKEIERARREEEARIKIEEERNAAATKIQEKFREMRARNKQDEDSEAIEGREQDVGGIDDITPLDSHTEEIDTGLGEVEKQDNTGGALATEADIEASIRDREEEKDKSKPSNAQKIENARQNLASARVRLSSLKARLKKSGLTEEEKKSINSKIAIAESNIQKYLSEITNTD